MIPAVEAAILILAGGRSSRMGSPKDEVLLLDGRTMIDHVLAAIQELNLPTYLSVSSPDRPGATHPGTVLIHDNQPFDGPLAALARAWEVADVDNFMVVCCDQPLLTAEPLRLLLKNPGHPTFFRRGDGSSLAPFPGLFPRRLVPAICAALAAGERSPNRFLASQQCSWITVEDDVAAGLRSFNSPEELRRAGLVR